MRETLATFGIIVLFVLSYLILKYSLEIAMIIFAILSMNR